ncbi:MAG: hypothetical protein LBT83_01160 [Tannerella sp.]|nr:hypothetical protein [Tannerella sp.]
MYTNKRYASGQLPKNVRSERNSPDARRRLPVPNEKQNGAPGDFPFDTKSSRRLPATSRSERKTERNAGRLPV